jgi:hypothetical protein
MTKSSSIDPHLSLCLPAMITVSDSYEQDHKMANHN